MERLESIDSRTPAVDGSLVPPAEFLRTEGPMAMARESRVRGKRLAHHARWSRPRYRVLTDPPLVSSQSLVG